MTDAVPTQMDDANEWLMSSAAKSASFLQIGAQVSGFICAKPEKQQQRDFDTGQPKYWPNSTEPMWQVRVILQTEERDPEVEEDDGRRAIYVKGNMRNAVQKALTQAGVGGLAVGGKLLVKYMSDDKPARKGLNGAKLYVAKYRPPIDEVALPEQEPATAVANVDPDSIPF
jgi:hypothetical protein